MTYVPGVTEKRKFFFGLQIHPVNLPNDLILVFLSISLERFSHFMRQIRDKLDKTQAKRCCSNDFLLSLAASMWKFIILITLFGSFSLNSVFRN